MSARVKSDDAQTQTAFDKPNAAVILDVQSELDTLADRVQGAFENGDYNRAFTLTLTHTRDLRFDLAFTSANTSDARSHIMAAVHLARHAAENDDATENDVVVRTLVESIVGHIRDAHDEI